METRRFATGIFKYDDGVINTSQRFHTDDCDPFDVENPFLDCPPELNLPIIDPDGYVSNCGKIAVIHIKDKQKTPQNISLVKRIFLLYESSGLSEVRIESFDPDLTEGCRRSGDDFDNYRIKAVISLSEDTGRGDMMVVHFETDDPADRQKEEQT